MLYLFNECVYCDNLIRKRNKIQRMKITNEMVTHDALEMKII